jgi:hypothetical protein
MAKESLKERLKKKQAELKAKQQTGAIFFQKADTTIRIRILNMGEEEEFIKEVTQFYLGADIKGVISPSTFAEPCAVMDAYDELKNSDDDEDKELASKFPPRKKYLAYCLFYKDLKGTTVDDNISPKFILLATGVYQDILEKYLDEDEWGDMTDPEDGYDIKIARTGSGKKDTEYTITPCKNTPTPEGFHGPYDLEKEVRKVMPTYEETKGFIEQFLGLEPEEENQPKKTPIKKKIIKKPKKDL